MDVPAALRFGYRGEEPLTIAGLLGRQVFFWRRQGEPLLRKGTFELVSDTAGKTRRNMRIRVGNAELMTMSDFTGPSKRGWEFMHLAVDWVGVVGDRWEHNGMQCEIVAPPRRTHSSYELKLPTGATVFADIQFASLEAMASGAQGGQTDIVPVSPVSAATEDDDPTQRVQQPGQLSPEVLTRLQGLVPTLDGALRDVVHDIVDGAGVINSLNTQTAGQLTDEQLLRLVQAREGFVEKRREILKIHNEGRSVKDVEQEIGALERKMEALQSELQLTTNTTAVCKILFKQHKRKRSVSAASGSDRS